ncbi:MAG: DUF523 domain-containing protein [Planctomycetes bacterium]|nr:DUF523 domain-containing protein [Planctomycetota bacterium]
MPPPVLVSACLLGANCRHDGMNRFDPALLKSLAGRDIVAVCPEELGGLGTPRPPAVLEADGARVLDGAARVVRVDGGADLTAAFVAGARAALGEGLRRGAVREAYLKARSPSCGVGAVHTVRGVEPGDGVFAALLRREGIRVTPVEGKAAPRPEESADSSRGGCVTRNPVPQPA